MIPVALQGPKRHLLCDPHRRDCAEGFRLIISNAYIQYGGKMTNSLFAVVPAMLVCVSAIAQASEPTCSSGRLAYLEGEINNNAVDFPGALPVTMGVAALKVSTEDESHRLTCALLGTPSLEPTHVYDHRIVCDDSEQSELSFDTSFIGADPLDPRLERKLCRGISVLSYFQERSLPDYSEPTKGIFRNVSEGEILVNGCVNAGSDPAPDIHINMVVDGYLCLEN